MERIGTRRIEAGMSGPRPVLRRAASPARMLAACLLALGAVVFLLTSGHARATTYKWVDDQGVVHYTDKIPPEAVNKGSIELNKQGVPIKKNEPARTPEQRRAREAEDERQRQAATLREETERRDRALLQSYTTESEIDLARKRALATIDAQVQSSQAYTAQLSKRKQELEVRRTTLGDKPAPAVLERELANIDDELAKQSELLTGKRKEAEVVNARYEADKQRWQALKSISEANAAAALGATATTVPANAPPGNAKR